MRKEFNPVRFLNHAAWHCKFGSAAVERVPEQGDLDAWLILRNLAESFLRSL